MSNDPVETLAAFARGYGITYPLLSDVRSQVIRQLGLENTGGGADARYQGLAHPGVIFVDRDGTVTAKRFERSHRIRPSGSVLLAEHYRSAGVEPAVWAEDEVVGVGIRVSSQTDRYHPKQTFQLDVRISVPSGHHVCVGGLPDGFEGLSIDLAGPESLEWGPAQLPAGEPFTVSGISDHFNVIDGSVDIAVPVRVQEDEGDVDLLVEVRLQVCTSYTCFPPTSARMVIPLRAAGMLSV
jgi:hypothetical protein